MSIIKWIFACAALLLFVGCSSDKSDVSLLQGVEPSAIHIGSEAEKAGFVALDAAKSSERSKKISLSPVNSSAAANGAGDRKIIRNAEFTVETDSPQDEQQKITAIVESRGGFVVTTARRQSNSAQSKPNETVTVVARIPSIQFGAALDEIHRLGGRILQEKMSGQDVTEEYIDLEAQLRAKKALEGQFFEILKQARKVSDAIEVQKEMADVRAEIEQLEGRRRFLENQSQLSTITVTLQTPAPVVAATSWGFGESIKRAFGEGVDATVAIITWLIRVIIVLIPVVVLIVLPLGLVGRILIRRYQLFQKAQPVAESE